MDSVQLRPKYSVTTDKTFEDGLRASRTGAQNKKKIKVFKFVVHSSPIFLVDVFST